MIRKFSYESKTVSDGRKGIVMEEDFFIFDVER